MFDTNQTKKKEKDKKVEKSKTVSSFHDSSKSIKVLNDFLYRPSRVLTITTSKVLDHPLNGIRGLTMSPFSFPFFVVFLSLHCHLSR
jgi:hypothetical protein